MSLLLITAQLVWMTNLITKRFFQRVLKKFFGSGTLPVWQRGSLWKGFSPNPLTTTMANPRFETLRRASTAKSKVSKLLPNRPLADVPYWQNNNTKFSEKQFSLGQTRNPRFGGECTLKARSSERLKIKFPLSDGLTQAPRGISLMPLFDRKPDPVTLDPSDWSWLEQ